MTWFKLARRGYYDPQHVWVKTAFIITILGKEVVL